MPSCLAAAIVALAVSDCTQWLPPQNIAEYPKWIYCNRRPNDGQTAYSYMLATMPPADVPPYQCTSGRVLRHDAAGIVCVDYTQGDGYGGACTDAQCCAEGICKDYTCTNGGTLRANAAEISCSYFPCNDYTCCDDPPGVPQHDAQGLVFVDRDPGRFSFGGKATIIRAADESDITHYRIYWGFAKTVRKVPSCGLKNPVSWEQFKFTDKTRLFMELPATGCDITFDIPMGTPPNVRCPITWDRLNKTYAANDPCNPHYFVVVTANANGEKSIAGQVQQLGPRHPISDYEVEYNLPCAEGGITMGHDIPGPDDVILGTWNGVDSAKDCAQLCRDYNGPKGPCRYWTFAYPTGGYTAKSCWMEAQTMQKAHYGVRVVGPAVCPTPDDQPPTGVERPRCNRWVRIPNMAPFTDRNAYSDYGGIYVQMPNLPDVPLGPYQNAQMCQALCDMDVLCIGFVWMKKDVTDSFFHRCILIHILITTMQPTVYYDSWMCSREGMAPLINGYEMQSNPFGYKTCEVSGAKGSRDAAFDYDCCADRCTADSACVAFTFYNTDKTCQLFSSCSTLTTVDKVTGCAYESCFDGYGLTTYKKQGNSMEIVDRWPVSGNSSTGMPTYVQATVGLEGRTVVCIAALSGAASIPTTAEAMVALSTGRSYSGVVKSNVAQMTIVNDFKGTLISDATLYDVRCGIESAASLGLPGYVSLGVTTEYPVGYVEITATNGNNGWCRDSSDRIVGTVAPSKPYTVAQCRALCDADSSCLAFQIRSSDGNCGLATTYDYTTVKADTLVRCFKKSSDNVHYIGDDRCQKQCDGTCQWELHLGSYTRNYFLSQVTSPCMQTDAPTNVPTSVPTAVPTPQPSPGPTPQPTPAPSPGPTPVPTPGPTPVPTPTPTSGPTPLPTAQPTLVPGTSPAPTGVPTSVPTGVPTPVPGQSSVPTSVPTAVPTLVPGQSAAPTSVPTSMPTSVPTSVPTAVPTLVPGQSAVPTSVPTSVPPTAVPTIVPTTSVPTLVPGQTGTPTRAPTVAPTPAPEDNKGSLWWLWVLLSVLFCVCVTVAGALAVRKRKHNASLDDFLVLEDNAEMMSAYSPITVPENAPSCASSPRLSETPSPASFKPVYVRRPPSDFSMGRRASSATATIRM